MAFFDYRYERPARKHFRWWYNRASRSRLQPMMEVGRMLHEHVQNSVETRGSPELVVYAAWAWAGGVVDSLASWSSNFGKWR